METVILIVSIIILLLAIITAVKVFSVKTDDKNEEINRNLIRLIEQNQNYNAQLTQQINNFSDTMRNNFGTLESSIRLINEKLFADTNLLISKLTEDTRNQLNKLTEDTRNQLDKMAADTRNQLDRSAAEDNQKLTKLNDDMLRSSKQTDDQIKEINRIVSEKMQDILTQKFNNAFETIVKNMSELSKSINDGQEKQKEELKYQLNTIKEEFSKIYAENKEKMDQIHAENKETMDRIREDNQKSLDKINETVNEKLQKSINDRISQSFEAVNNRLSEVYRGLGEMKEVASGVKDLKNVLANVKTRGILGEIQLSAILEEILTKDQYEEQFKLTPNSRDLVDFAIKLPGQEDGKYVYLPIDSKFPGGRWSDLAEAYESGDTMLVKERRKLLETEIKTCARSIRDKYIKPPYTTDFAIMFLPFEGL